MKLIEKHKTIEGTLNSNPNTGEHTAMFNISKLYINNTHKKIGVIHRNHLPVIIPSNVGPEQGLGDFISRTIYKFMHVEHMVTTANMIYDMIGKYSITTNDISIINKEIIKLIDKRNYLQSINICIDKTVPYRDINIHKTIFLQEDDIVICSPEDVLNHPHPKSIEGLALEEQSHLVMDNCVTGIFVELIDNEHQAGKRFMYAGKQLIEIPALRNNNKPSGVYINRVEYDEAGCAHMSPEKLSFELASEKYGIYTTKEAAMTNGNPEILHATRLEELTNANALLKKESDKVKLQIEQVETKYKSDNLLLSQELERSKISSAKLKEELDAAKAVRNDYYDNRSKIREDVYEDRSYERKDSSEWLKIAAIIGGVAAGVYAAVNKSK